MASFIEQVWVVVAPYVGYYSTGVSAEVKPAISQTFAIGKGVAGLEVVVGDPEIDVERKMGGGREETYRWTLYLTQWQGDGAETIMDAIAALVDSDLGYEIEATPTVVAGSQAMRRYVVTIMGNCLC